MDYGSLLSGAAAVGGLFGGGGESYKETSKLNHAYQVNLLRNQIPLMVEGAKEAGLHPLTAVGVNPASFSGGISSIGESKWDALDNLGQNISRARTANMDKSERATVEAANGLKLENMKLQNDLLRSQITTIQNPTTPPQGGDRLGSNQGAEYVPARLNSPTGVFGSKEGGATTDFNYSRTSGGGLAIIPSADVKQRIEDATIPELQWSARNTHLMPPTAPSAKEFPLPKGYNSWRWNPFTQTWSPSKSKPHNYHKALREFQTY